MLATTLADEDEARALEAVALAAEVPTAQIYALIARVGKRGPGRSTRRSNKWCLVLRKVRPSPPPEAEPPPCAALVVEKNQLRAPLTPEQQVVVHEEEEEEEEEEAKASSPPPTRKKKKKDG